MIVVDASALVELVLNTEAGQLVAARIEDPSEGLHVPHLADIEVAQALRRYVLKKDLDEAAAMAALDAFCDLDLQRHSHEPLLQRIWALRQNLTAYDAAYVALAEALDCVLLTCDRPLSRSPHLSAQLELIQ